MKKIVLIGIAAAISTPAFAETDNVKIYGVAHVSYDLVDNGSAGATRGVRVNKVSSNSSRIGFRGAEYLGDNLQAVWQIESLVVLDGSAASTLGTRNTFVGLNSDTLGKVLLGRHDTPYKLSTRRLDVFADTLADSRTLLGGTALSATKLASNTAITGANVGALGSSAAVAFDGRPTNTLIYISPAINGITGAISYVAGAEAVSLDTQTKGSAWSLASWYDVGPLYGSVAYEVHNFGTSTVPTGTLGPLTGTALGDLAGKKESAWKVGVGYKASVFEVNAEYETTTDNLTKTTNADLLGHKAYYLSGKYKFGTDAVKLAYTYAGKLAGAAAGTDTRASQISLGYDHNLSKRTTVYALYTKLNNGANAKYALSTASNASGTTAASAVGADPSAWSVGLKHSF
ncbi:MAG TPA: porin [Gallionella sp.]|nr:porin [Gallionella sp.]